MRFRHRKRGTIYGVIDIIWYKGKSLVEGDSFPYRHEGDSSEASFQYSGGRFDEGFVVLYYSKDNGKDYARPALEFFDGRFEQI